MPVTKCPNGKYKIGSGPCVYETKEKAEKAYEAYRAKEHTNSMEIVCFEVNVEKNEIQYKEYMGRQHLIAPVVLLVEGVHNAFFYPAEELEKFPASWNGVPLPIFHPEDESNGMPVSCTDPEVMEKMVIGNLWNVIYDEATRKLKGEIWIDIDRAKMIDKSIIPALESGYKMEVSTGLWADHFMEPGEWNGEEYVGILKNYRPDHLALLPGAVGACSWEDGCGIRANKRKEESKIVTNKRKVRIKVANNLGKTEPGKKFMDIISVDENFFVDELSHEDVRQSLQDMLFEFIKPQPSEDDHEVGPYAYIRDVFENYFVFESRSDEGSNGLWKCNYKIANDKIEITGDPIEVQLKTEYVELQKHPDDTGDKGKAPDDKSTTKKVDNNNLKTNKEGGKKDMSELTNEQRTELIMKLIANEEGKCIFCEEDKEYLEKMSDEKLQALVAKFAPETNADGQEPPKKDGVEDGKQDKDEPEVKANKKDDDGKKKDKVDANAKQKKEEPEKKEQTFDEFMANAPVDYKEMIDTGLKIHKENKDKLIKTIIGNERNKYTQVELEAKGIEELKKIVDLMGEDVDFTANAGGQSHKKEVKANEKQEDGTGVPDMPTPIWVNGKPDYSQLN